MPGSANSIQRRYFYDPLNQLTGVGPAQGTGTQRFYQAGRVTTELEPGKQTTIFRQHALPLAQQQSAGRVADTALLMTDRAQSLMRACSRTDSHRLSYTVYGYSSEKSGISELIGFNGEPLDELTGYLPLGKGTRFYNPTLMRFNSPDSFSPFNDGGINSYVYCSNDPVNFTDPTGRSKHGILPNGGRPPVIVENGYYKKGKGTIYIVPDSLIDQPEEYTALYRGSQPKETSVRRHDFTSKILRGPIEPTPFVKTRTEQPSRSVRYHYHHRAIGARIDKKLLSGETHLRLTPDMAKQLMALRKELRSGPNAGPLRANVEKRLTNLGLAIRSFTSDYDELEATQNLQLIIRNSETR